ncbi:MurR/RpiR family transcriptional regulator [Prosthecomicrobium pneumaticum]|uniref:DNA-binding MurR/RpiR family transcriptional regulator n=1 Tax=Prosthecomicrobium pneumaticum TaxID=81895 RepID=A0A7W9FJY8_9HYPH|nr:MurR/RpiR family transcriptional regulator [Prosthecomicrobium pneumaticum]MBB5752232.1 DNA-binding MurR/RpiR family transcriptional regulator [Prosthecomicrobium pneumaticum]
MRDILDIVMRIRLRAEEGSKSDRRLAALILADVDFASKASIAELATRAGVSEPTVTRFCRTLGCEGIRDFKFHLAQALAVGGIYLNADAPDRDARESRIATAVAASAIAAIERIRDSLDMSGVMGVAAAIARAEQVVIVGSGGTSSMMAVEMQNRLFRLGVRAAAYTDGQLQRMAASVARPETVLIAFSTSGFARSAIDATVIARQYGATTIAITAADSPLAAAAEFVVGFAAADDPNIYKPHSSRYALLAIVDMIATATAETIGPKVLEGLRRLKQSLATFKVNNPRLPLGD